MLEHGVCASTLRDMAITLVESNREHHVFDPDKAESLRFPASEKYGWNTLKHSRTFIYEYFKLLLLAQEAGLIAQPECKKQLTETWVPIASAIVTADLRQATVLFAMTAWLSVDNYRWPDKYKIPNDLFYGLVLQYPGYILGFSSFVLSLEHRNRYLSMISESSISKCEEIAHTYTNRNMASNIHTR